MRKKKIKAIIQNRTAISGVDFHLPNGDDIRMSGLRKFAAVAPLYTMQSDGETLYNNESGEALKPKYGSGLLSTLWMKTAHLSGTPPSLGICCRNWYYNFGRYVER